jgi:hypothetical protein
MARLIGAKIHDDRLRRLGGRTVKSKVFTALEAGAGLIAEFAKHSIIVNGVSGPGHIVSDPGKPPNADTHELDQSIHVVSSRANMTATVVADSEKAAELEYGTSRMEERPYMRPAGKAMRPKARGLVAAAIRAASKGA